MAIFRKVDPRIWEDSRFRSLSGDGQRMYLRLLTHYDLQPMGWMRYSLDSLGRDLGTKRRKTRQALLELASGGLLDLDEECQMLFIPGYVDFAAIRTESEAARLCGNFHLLPATSLSLQIIALAIKGAAIGNEKAAWTIWKMARENGGNSRLCLEGLELILEWFRKRNWPGSDQDRQEDAEDFETGNMNFAANFCAEKEIFGKNRQESSEMAQESVPKGVNRGANRTETMANAAEICAKVSEKISFETKSGKSRAKNCGKREGKCSDLNKNEEKNADFEQEVAEKSPEKAENFGPEMPAKPPVARLCGNEPEDVRKRPGAGSAEEGKNQDENDSKMGPKDGSGGDGPLNSEIKSENERESNKYILSGSGNPHPDRSPEEVVIALPCTASKIPKGVKPGSDGPWLWEEYRVSVAQAREWQELYPAVDVAQELRNMLGWIRANWKRRKTHGGMARFITGWLAREQNRASNARLAGPPRPKSEWGRRQEELRERSEARLMAPGPDIAEIEARLLGE